MDRENKTNFGNLLRTVKYIHDTKNKYLCLKPTMNEKNKWTMKTYVDSDWERDPDSRISITGWVIFVNECLVAWGSKAQKSVTLSSTEAEYVEISELCTNVIHVRSLLEFMGEDVSLPITILVDNQGAIYLANNSTGKRTKHVDIKYHFVREYVEDGTVKIIFVHTDLNQADVNTKNTSTETYARHTGKYMVYEA